MQTTLVRAIALLSLVILFGTSCATPPVPRVVSAKEKLREDSRIGGHLIEKFEAQLSLREDMEVSVYLRRLAETLAKGVDPLRQTPIGVQVIKDHDRRWRNFALPGVHIYLSSSLVRKFEFENQLAAAMAFEFANVVRRHAVHRLAHRPSPVHTEGDPVVDPDPVFPADSLDLSHPVDYFGPSGIFAFSEEDLISSAQFAVDILFHGGYDTRGLLSIWEIYKANPKRSPYEQSTLAKLIDKTREFQSGYPPLRNPIVRSDEFLKIRKRIERL